MDENQLPEIIINEAETAKPKRRKSSIGNTPLEISQQGVEVGTNIQELPYALKRFTWTEMLEKAILLKNTITEKNASQTSRNPISKQLRDIIKEAEKSGGFLKNAVKSKLALDVAVKMFPELGFRHDKRGYNFPAAHVEFIAAMDQLLIGLVKYELTEFEFGLAYWTNLRQRFVETYNLSGTTVTNSSKGVGNTGLLATEVKDMLSATLALIKIEEPDTWERTARNLGFRREKY